MIAGSAFGTMTAGSDVDAALLEAFGTMTAGSDVGAALREAFGTMTAGSGGIEGLFVKMGTGA